MELAKIANKYDISKLFLAPTREQMARLIAGEKPEDVFKSDKPVSDEIEVK